MSNSADSFEDLILVRDRDRIELISQLQKYNIDKGRIDDACDIEFLKLNKGEIANYYGKIRGFKPNQEIKSDQPFKLLYINYSENNKLYSKLTKHVFYVASIKDKLFKKYMKKSMKKSKKKSKKYTFNIYNVNNPTKLIFYDGGFHTTEKPIQKPTQKPKENSRKQKSIVNYQNNTIAKTNSSFKLTRDEDGLLNVDQFDELYLICRKDASKFVTLLKDYTAEKGNLEDICNIDFMILNNGQLNNNNGRIMGFRPHPEKVNSFCILYYEFGNDELFRYTLSELFHVAFITDEQFKKVKKEAIKQNLKNNIDENLIIKSVEYVIEFYYVGPKYFVKDGVNMNVINYN